MRRALLNYILLSSKESVKQKIQKTYSLAARFSSAVFAFPVGALPRIF
jgi:hypothetical protein